MAAETHCQLCGQIADLRESHVIPRFVSKWLKKTTPGHLRTVSQPNKRIQDGPIEKWLCASCEQRFSDHERVFAEQIFRYVHETSETPRPVPYGDWALKFAVSISWRTLLYYRDKGLDHLSKVDLAALQRAERVWREFLLSERAHPGEFEQHVLTVDALEQASGMISPYLNRYLLRTVHSDIVTSRSMCFTHTKLCRIIVIGFVRTASPRRWKGTKLHVRSGRIGGDCEVPQVLMSYWNDKADQAAAALAAISEKQKRKVDDLLTHTDPVEFATSEVFRAVQADVEFSGARAFTSTGRSSRKRTGAG